VPTLVDANGVHPLTLDSQPDLHQLGLMQQVKAVERHVIAAATTGSASEALKAFALHPLVDSVNVARDWRPGAADARGRFLREVHDGACAVWNVVLGPEYNAAHRDHFHLDVGASRACR